MSLSNEIITHQLDPVFFDQRRAEFRLDPKVYLSNWRLADLGIQVAGGNSATTSKHHNNRYATNLGAYAIIDRIRLLNGSVELAELRNVNQYLAFNNLQRTNANAFNVNRTLNKSSFALDVESDDSGVPRMQLKKYGEMDTTLTNDANTPLSYLDLTQVLGFLKSQSYVLGTELQSLRLVIEFLPNTAANIEKVLLSKDTITGFTIIKPTLIIDELADSTAAKKLKNKPLTYINMDHEVVNVAANATTINQRLRAFDDKLVRRMLMINEDVNNTTPSQYFGGLTSYAMYNQKIQFSLNGGKMFPYNGIENENQQLAMLNDVWGTHILPQGAQMFDLRHKPSLYAYQKTGDAELEEAGNLVGQMSYAGFEVNQNIDELQLEYQRSAYTPVLTKVTVASTASPVVLTAAAHGLLTGDIVKIADINSSGTAINGTHVATVLDADTFSVPFDNSGAILTVGAQSYVMLSNAALKNTRSNAQCNLLFWGEVVKTMSVSNNVVKVVNN
eukprot:gene3454-31163_t